MRLLDYLFPRAAVWKPFCQELGGRYVRRGFWRVGVVEFPYRTWTITLRATKDAEGFVFTTFQTFLGGRVDFMLGVLRNWPGQVFFDLLTGRLGLKETGLSELGGEFCVLSNDHTMARTVLEDQQVQEHLQQQPKVCVLVHRRCWILPRWGKPELRVMVPSVVRDVQRIRSLLMLIRALLRRLTEVGLVLRPP